MSSSSPRADGGRSALRRRAECLVSQPLGRDPGPVRGRSPGAVREADELVSTVIGELESSFHSRRDSLEAGWQEGDDTSTEGLRLALQAYRSFFGRLLNT